MRDEQQSNDGQLDNRAEYGHLCAIHGGERDQDCAWCQLMDALQPTLPGFSARELEAACK